MKIQTVETLVLQVPYTAGGSKDAQAWGGQAWRTADVLLVKITTDEGLVGWGEAFGYNAIPATKAAIDTMIAPLMIGRNPLSIESLMLEAQQKLHIFGRGGPVIYGLSGIDIALWDIAGKASNKPVHAMLGGARRQQLPCYASLIRYAEPPVVAENVARAVGEGFEHIKLHEIEVAPTAAARAAAGDKVEIMLDVNCPWTPKQAIEMAAKLKASRLRWLEEPVWPPENYDAIAQVREKGGIATAAGENAGTLLQFDRMLEAQAVDFVQPSPTKMGGISELRKVFMLAAAHQVTVMPHSFYDGPGLLAAIQVIAALGDESLVEWRYFDIEERLYGDVGVPVKGKVAVPNGPGLGADPDPKLIARYRV